MATARAAEPMGVEGNSCRMTLSLDGPWQVAEGNSDAPPSSFAGTMQVPGLVNQATPTFDKEVSDGHLLTTFWLQRSFTLAEPVPSVAVLRIGQALYGFKVWVNGQCLAENARGQVPTQFDIRKALRPGVNEICIGLHTMASVQPESGKLVSGWEFEKVPRWPGYELILPKSGRIVPGWDFEKDSYSPGLTDSVDLLLTETPFVKLVQVVPDTATSATTVHAWLQGAPAGAAPVTVEILEARSGKSVGITTVQASAGADGAVHVVATVAMPGGHFWTPEDPFLYIAKVTTAKDCCATRFGLRTFHFDAATGRAMLNGKPYYMRGTNYCLQRFLGDPECGRLPWDPGWVRALFRQGKSLNWNCARFCIGLMPQLWYDLADEEGLLLQDEYPFWTLHRPYTITADELAADYRAMMEAHWNHPAVVVWDACNETRCQETHIALNTVRDLDFSNRPWDDGWSTPTLPTDTVEAHPYHFSDPKYKLAQLESAKATLEVKASKAVIVNEYGWLWLTRDGNPCTVTGELYPNLLGTNSTVAQRRHLYALYLAAETEFWRHSRQQAAVMHFCSLAYSRSNGPTSDHFLPGGVAGLKLEPEFEKYARDAFAPVSVMLKFWRPSLAAGSHSALSVSLINDLYEAWSGPVTLRVKRGDRVLVEKKQGTRVEALGTTNLVFDIAWPEQTGPCVLEAELQGADGKPVHSVRDLEILDKTDAGKGGMSEIRFAPVEARHVRLHCTKRGTAWGQAVCELQVFE